MERAAALIDPMLPDEGIEAFRGREPEVILLTNRHHYRHSDRFVEAFGCRVLCHRAGLHEFAGGPDVEGFSFGDDVANGVLALEVGALTPEETAFHIDPAPGALSFGDAFVNRSDGGLGFVSDKLIGDDPEAVKEGLREAFRRLLAHDFDALLVAHGEPDAARRQGGAAEAGGGRLTVTRRRAGVPEKRSERLEQPTEPTPPAVPEPGPVPSPVPGPVRGARADASADPGADPARRARALPARWSGHAPSIPRPGPRRRCPTRRPFRRRRIQSPPTPRPDPGPPLDPRPI